MQKLCFILATVFLLVGCALNKPITPSQFMFRCSMKPSPGSTSDKSGSCGDQYQICLDFQNTILESKDGAACVQTCRDLKNKYYRRYPTDNCRWTAKQAYDLCTLYCMSNFE